MYICTYEGVFMAGNNAIQILRGSRDTIINNKGVKLKAGQLLYNKTDNYLTVGATDDDLLTKLPIRCREIFGYKGDTESIGEADIPSQSYSIKYDNSNGVVFKSPDTFKFEIASEKFLEMSNDGVIFKSPNTFKFESTSESEKFLEMSNTNGLILHKDFGLTVKNEDDNKNLLEARNNTVKVVGNLTITETSNPDASILTVTTDSGLSVNKELNIINNNNLIINGGNIKIGNVTFNYDSADKCLNFNFD